MKTRYDERWENDTTPSRDAVKAHRVAKEQGEYSDGLTLVSYRGTQEELNLGLEYARSEDPLDREVGADVLAQLGWSDYAFLEESVGALIKLLQDKSNGVIAAAAIGLGHRNHPDAIPHLIKLATNPDEEIRYAVVIGLLAHDDPRAIASLIQFSQDADSDVRDWALFGLGSQLETDTPAIREALFRGLSDSDDNARAEAQAGLAHRNDERVVEALIKEFERESVGNTSLEAAAFIADPRLRPSLLHMRESFELDDDGWTATLEDAIATCQPYKEEQFGDSAELAETLAQLIFMKKKTATCSSLWQWQAEGEEPPAVGTRTIILEGNKKRLCLIEVTEVTIRAYSEIDEAFAKEEGEGDGTLDDWRRVHWDFFTRTLKSINRQPAEDMPLVCERFKAIYRWN